MSVTRPFDSWPQPAGAAQGERAATPHGEAMLRSYGIDRAIDYGMAVDDMLRLEARVRGGAAWVDVLVHLGEDNLARAAHQVDQQHTASASAFHLLAAACFRLAQAGSEEEPAQRLALYERQAAAFALGAAASGWPAQALTVDDGGARHQAWLVRPRDVPTPPCVLVWGGADGWCEAFWRSVPSFLERGLAVCLLELPGQGLARLRDGAFLRQDFPRMVGQAMDALTAMDVHPGRFGVVGHSFGGTLAMAAAGAHARIRGCVSNGGMLEPRKDDKYPRATQRLGRMLGPDADVPAFCASLDLPNAIRSMPGRLLCVQGGKDVLVSDEQARQIVDLRGPSHAALAHWPDGVHCIYNHALERNAVVADWLAQVLASP